MSLGSSRRSTRQALQAGSTEMTGNGPNTFPVVYPLTKLSQEEQDNADQEKKRESIHTLVQTWLDSLQLISIITTFFVATEASWLVITIPVPNTEKAGLSTIGQLANIGIMSALIIHIHAAIISFLAAFCLIRHKLTVAQKEEEKFEEKFVHSPKPISLNLSDPEKAKVFRPRTYADDLRAVRRPVRSSLSGDQIIWSTNPHLVHVGPFERKAPTELLARCHSLCVFLAFLGFLLALMGAISFTWDQLPRSIGISATVSTIFCLVAAISILIVPSTNPSHIFLQ